MKYKEYAILIAAKISELFDEDDESYISEEDLFDDENLTQFIHAMANAAPNIMYNNITGDNKNNLEFNHLANGLCFQYMNKVPKPVVDDSNE